MNLDTPAILNALPEATLLLDSEGVVRHVNPAAERLLGVRAADLVGGRELPHISAEWLNENGNRSYIYLDYRRRFEVKIIPCGSDDLKASASMVIYHDKTAVQDLYLAMHYNLRTFLSSIRGFSQLLAMETAGPLSDDQKQFVHSVVDNSKKMLWYIEALLSYAEIVREGDIVLHTAQFNINILIEDVFGSANGQQWTREIENADILGDKEKLSVVFWFLKFQTSYDDKNGLSVHTFSESGHIKIEIKIDGNVYPPLWDFGPRDVCERILVAHGGTFELDATIYEACACIITLPIASEPATS